MSRIVSDEPNSLTINDNLSGTQLKLFYRAPTTEEHARYTNGMTKRNRNKLVNCTGQNRQKHGREILEGFREGDFGEKKGKKTVMISSDPNSKDYNPDWKNWFCKHNADLVEILAIHVFENPADVDDDIEMDGDQDEDQERDTHPN